MAVLVASSQMQFNNVNESLMNQQSLINKNKMFQINLSGFSPYSLSYDSYFKWCFMSRPLIISLLYVNCVPILYE